MSESQTIKMDSGSLIVPDNPIIPYIEGDGIGPDIWYASVNVFDNAVEKACQILKANITRREFGSVTNHLVLSNFSSFSPIERMW